MKHGKRLFTIGKRFSLWSYSVFLNMERKSAFPVQQLSVSRIRATPSCMPGYSLLRTLLRRLKKGFWNSIDLNHEYQYLVDTRQLLPAESNKAAHHQKNGFNYNLNQQILLTQCWNTYQTRSTHQYNVEPYFVGSTWNPLRTCLSKDVKLSIRFGVFNLDIYEKAEIEKGEHRATLPFIQLTAISYQLSANSYQLSAIS